MNHYDLKQLLDAVKKDWNVLKNIPAPLQSYDICLAALNRNASAIKYIKNPDDRLCYAAVSKDGCTIQYISNQTPELCLTAVKQNPAALQFIKKENQRTDACLEALSKGKQYLTYVKICPSVDLEETIKFLSKIKNKELIKDTVRNLA